MKFLKLQNLNFQQLKSSAGDELYSLSALLSEALSLGQLLIHRDELAPGHRTSAPHRHTLVEEVVYVISGEVLAQEPHRIRSKAQKTV